MGFVVSFQEEEAYPLALEEYVSICGFKPESEKHQKMLAAGMKIREAGIGGINIRALLSLYDPEVIHEGGMEINGVKLRCDSLFWLDKEKIRRIILYIMTVNECTCDSEDILDMVYADFWGTAYAGAAFKRLRAELNARYVDGIECLALSEAYGPGYYGMPTGEMKNFFSILDGEKIGVRCMPSCIMLPVKSCVGMFFIMEKGAKSPESYCKDCAGNPSGCRLCGLRNRIQ